MEKRYQVFVSSTYADLKKERQRVIQTLMERDCIPAGMELFPALDEDQFEFIKKIIDDCDYYLVIIGGRYGSLDPNGISYTEKAYECALNRGINVVALLHKRPDFRNRVSQGRLVRFLENCVRSPRSCGSEYE